MNNMQRDITKKNEREIVEYQTNLKPNKNMSTSESARERAINAGFKIISWESKICELECPKNHRFVRKAAMIFRWGKGTHPVVCEVCKLYNNFVDVKTRCEKKGQILLTPENEFRNGYDIIVRCKCGNERHTAINNVEKNIYGCHDCLDIDEFATKHRETTIKNAQLNPRYQKGTPEYLHHQQEIQAKTRATNLERYGHESVLKSEEVKAKIRATNLERYGHEIAFKSEEVKAKIRATNLERYGHENISQSEEIKAKIRATNLERYGHESVMKSEEVKAKIRATNLERYGHENPAQSEEVKAKMRSTMLATYGAEHMMQIPELRAKRDATMIERYGQAQSSHVPEIFEKISKSRFKHKEMQLSDGRTVSLQGYEPQALMWLIRAKTNAFVDPTLERQLVPEDLLFTKIDMPEIYYSCHRYYADFFVKESNTVIEVKSPYTLMVDWDVNIQKFEASLTSGYDLLIIVWFRKSLIGSFFLNSLEDLHEWVDAYLV
jgi:hypothetical protein